MSDEIPSGGYNLERQPSGERPSALRRLSQGLANPFRRMGVSAPALPNSAALLEPASSHTPQNGGLNPAPLPDPNAIVLGSIGSLEVRLANSSAELRQAQNLRYRIFYEEMSARPSWRNRLLRRDFDTFDPFCQHLLVFDYDAAGASPDEGPTLVGTYRMLSQRVADAHGGFYSKSEFDIDALIARHPTKNFLELGRSCVLKPYRSKRTVELLWHGIWSYVVGQKIDVLFGCASLEGTDPSAIARPLSFLHHNALVDDAWYVRAVADRRVPMDRLAKSQIDTKAALRDLPPLIKGYLRLGGMIGDGAVVDHQFGTTDVLIMLPVEKISKRYINFYGTDASRRAC